MLRALASSCKDNASHMVSEKARVRARLVPYNKRAPLRHVIEVKKQTVTYAYGKSDIINLKQNTGEWLEWRKKGVGSSLVGTIVGLNGAFKEADYKPYKTPIMAWRQFLGKVPPDEANYHMQRGHDQEEGIAQKYAEVTGNKIADALCYQHRTQKWAKVTDKNKNKNRVTMFGIRMLSTKHRDLTSNT